MDGGRCRAGRSQGEGPGRRAVGSRSPGAREDRPGVAAGSRSAPGDRGGFTLLELLVVITVLAVLGGLAVPALRPPPEPPAVEEAAGRVEALFRLARIEAVRRGVEVTVILDSASARSWVEIGMGGPPAAGELPGASPQAPPGGNSGVEGAGEGGRGEAESRWFAGTARASGASLELPAGVELLLPSARASWHFHPSGGARGDPVHLQGPGGERWVVLNPWSGHASVH